MAALQTLVDLDWKLISVVASSDAAAVAKPLLRLSLFVGGDAAPSARAQGVREVALELNAAQLSELIAQLDSALQAAERASA